MGHNQNLRSFVERIERLEEEKRRLAEDIAEVKKEVKSAGFDVKTMNRMIRERKQNEAARLEQLRLDEIYRAALGMLDGTPLGTWARKSLSGDDPPPADDRAAPQPQPGDFEEPRQPAAPALPPVTPELIAAARVEGAEAAKAEKKITENPYPANDARRAAWDEGWCAEAGSDGMDIPPAFRRKKPKPDGGEG